MIFTLNIIQIVLAILLVIAILLQQRGGGLSPVFGGESGAYRTRRGIERIVFRGTIVLATLFFAAATVNVYLQSNARLLGTLTETENRISTSTVSIPETTGSESEGAGTPGADAAVPPEANE